MDYQTYLDSLHLLLTQMKTALSFSTELESVKELMVSILNAPIIEKKGNKNDYIRGNSYSQFAMLYSAYNIDICIGDIHIADNLFIREDMRVGTIIPTVTSIVVDKRTKRVYNILSYDDFCYECASNEESFLAALLEYQKIVLGFMIFKVDKMQSLYKVTQLAGGMEYMNFWQSLLK